VIAEPSTNEIWPAEAVVGVLASVVQNTIAAAGSVAAEGSSAVELTTRDAWARLMRQISTIADHGGGHLLIRCVPNDEMGEIRGTEFYLTIPEEPRPEQNETASKSVPRDNAAPQPVRIVTDPNAPALQPQDVDRLYPWRQKDLLRELNKRLGRRVLNSYDIQAIRRQHHLDEHPEYVFNLPGAGRRYSPAVADWIMEQHNRDPEFFHRARLADHDLMALRRHKPR
jgi:hypothetical protein